MKSILPVICKLHKGRGPEIHLSSAEHIIGTCKYMIIRLETNYVVGTMISVLYVSLHLIVRHLSVDILFLILMLRK